MNRRQSPRSLIYTIGLLGILWIMANPLRAQEEEKKKDVPYVPTPKPVVEKMLDLADVQKGDYVIDLGSGDGRIVIEAARRGADGHGIEIDPSKVREARNNAKRAGVADQVRFLKKDLFKTDISRATVVTLYLLPTINLKLRSRLLNKLNPGTKVVSHRFDMENWKPDQKVVVNSDDSEPSFLFDKSANFTIHKKTHDVYYWVIPADVDGHWTWKSDGHSFSLHVKQKFQTVQLELKRDGKSMQVDNAVLKGRRFRFKAESRDVEYIFNGRVESGRIKGIFQVRKGDESEVDFWNAVRD